MDGKMFSKRINIKKQTWLDKDKNITEVMEFDENGYCIYLKDYKDGFEMWCEYDENGNEIHTKNSKGFEQWYEYDDHGNMIHAKNSNGEECYIEYEYWS